MAPLVASDASLSATFNGSTSIICPRGTCVAAANVGPSREKTHVPACCSGVSPARSRPLTAPTRPFPRAMCVRRSGGGSTPAPIAKESSHVYGARRASALSGCPSTLPTPPLLSCSSSSMPLPTPRRPPPVAPRSTKQARSTAPKRQPASRTRCHRRAARASPLSPSPRQLSSATPCLQQRPSPAISSSPFHAWLPCNVIPAGRASRAWGSPARPAPPLCPHPRRGLDGGCGAKISTPSFLPLRCRKKKTQATEGRGGHVSKWTH